MKPQNTLCMTAMAGAVAAAFAVAPAFGAQQILGGGSSAVNTSAQFIILNDYCAGATNIVYYDNGSAPKNTTAAPFSSPGGTVWRITCNGTSTTKFTSGVDVSYDTSGGSWKGLIAADQANLLTAAAQSTTANPYPMSTVNQSGTTLSGYVAKVFTGTFTFTYVYGATVSILPPTATVTFGLTDVEPILFLNSYNEPEVNSTWDGTNGVVAAATPEYAAASLFSPTAHTFTGSAGSASTPYPAFGEMFAVVASPKLYLALQKDQSATGVLPTTCVASTATVSNTDSICIPFIGKAQYASLVGGVNSFTAGGVGLAPLFTSIIPADASVEVARRDQGSGTQSTSNAYFLGQGCVLGTEGINYPFQPVDVGVNPGGTTATESQLFYSYNFTTGQVLSRVITPAAATAPAAGFIATATNPVPAAIPGTTLTPTLQPGPTSGFVIGVVGASNAGSLSAGAGFLRLDGFYPNTANANLGLYNFISPVHFYGNPAASGDGLTLIVDLLGVNGVPAAETLAGFSGTGTVQYSASNWYDSASMCQGWQHK